MDFATNVKIKSFSEKYSGHLCGDRADWRVDMEHILRYLSQAAKTKEKAAISKELTGWLELEDSVCHPVFVVYFR